MTYHPTTPPQACPCHSHKPRLSDAVKALMYPVLFWALAACGGQPEQPQAGASADKASVADSMVLKLLLAYQTAEGRRLTDSLEQSGDITPIMASYYRGASYMNEGDLTSAEQHLQQAVALYHQQGGDALGYVRAGTLLSRALESDGDFEGAMGGAMEVERAIDSLGLQPAPSDLTALTFTIGLCQLKLSRPDDATASFDKGYRHALRWMASDPTGAELPRIINQLDNVTRNHLDASMAAEAEKWANREDSLLNVYAAMPAMIPEKLDMYRGSVSLSQAQIAQERGLADEAERAYQRFLATDFSKTDLARINAIDYLLMANRNDEAADNYAVLDTWMADYGVVNSLESISLYLLPKLMANYKAHRRDSALAVAMQIAALYDSALVRQRHDNAEELATIYDTQGKEMQIAQQQVRLARARNLALIVSIVTLLIVFAAFTAIRHRAARRLAAIQAAKERIEGELSVAREIQMSMLPSRFPQYEGLDMAAMMTPAKEVGGDLYGFLHKGDQLYIAVGDVSGKGVPASLFMAQATRLFNLMAMVGLKPAKICSYINDALSGEDNQNAMFVTMFVALIDLKSGHMDFCNAGHNPPIISDADGKSHFLKMNPNAPIGLYPGLEYEGEEIDTIKGRPMLIYTDGLNEAENVEQEQFGEERIVSFLHDHHYDSGQQLIKELAAEVDKFRNGNKPTDDLTLMCLSLKDSTETNSARL